jgi:hypothetical protein
VLNEKSFGHASGNAEWLDVAENNVVYKNGGLILDPYSIVFIEGIQ